jgi:hypothetical protein
MDVEYFCKILYKDDLYKDLYKDDDRTTLVNNVCDFSNNISKFYELLDMYNYDSLLYLNTIEKYNGIISDDNLKLISEHNVLIIGDNYNVKLDNLPNNIKLIVINCDKPYIHPLHNLPNNLEHLIFNTPYNQLLDYLPYGLKTLEINDYCNVELNNLPSSLKKLSISGRYNKPFINLPEDLEILILSEFYRVKLPILPSKLKELYIGADYYLPLVNLPDSIEILTITGSPAYIDKLPSNLKKLHIGFDAYVNVKLHDLIEEISVSTYSICLVYNLLAKHIPSNLKRILLNPNRHYNYVDDEYIIVEEEYLKLKELQTKYPNYEVRFNY